MKYKTKIILLIALFVCSLCIISIASIAYAEEETEQSPVKLFVGSADNIVESGTITNQSFGVIVEEAGFVYIRFPNQNYESRYVSTSIKFSYVANGTYCIYGYSRMSAPTIVIELEIYITLDNTSPVIALFEDDSPIADGAFVQGSIKAEITDNLAGLETVSVNISETGFVQYNGEVLTTDGVYEFLAIDIAGNESRACITKDTQKPTLEICDGGVQLPNNAKTNSSYIEVLGIDLLSGVEAIYFRKVGAEVFERHNQSLLQLTESGHYEFYAVDFSGNISEMGEVQIDNVAPVVSITHEGQTLQSNSYINGALITFHLDETTSTGYVYKASSGTTSTILNGATFTSQDIYTFYAIDDFNNKSTETVVIMDRTKPTGSVYTGSTAVSNGATVYSSFKYLCSDDLSGIDYCEIKKPNSSWSVYVEGTTIPSNNYGGEYSFRSTDLCGNVSSITTVYLVADTPLGVLTGVTHNGHTNKNVTFSWYGSGYATLYKDGVVVPYNSGDEISDEATYKIILRNSYDYSAQYNFVIDKTPPVFQTSEDISNGYVKANAVFWSENNITATIVLDAQEARQYTNGAILTENGHYLISLTDRAGNTSIVEFVIDNTPPTLTLSGLNDGDVTSLDVIVTGISEDAEVTVYIADMQIDYTIGGVLTEEAIYTVIVRDRAGNQTTYMFEIDKTSPKITSSQDISNGYSKDNSIIWEEDDVLATVTFNGQTRNYERGEQLAQDGLYIIRISDKVGNTTTVEFIIDNVPPTVELLGVINTGETKSKVKITNLSETATVEVYLDGNRIDYKVGNTLSKLGTYSVTVTDQAGNETLHSFRIIFSLNAAGIIFVVIIVIGIGTLIVLFLVRKKLINFDFMKRKKN